MFGRNNLVDPLPDGEQVGRLYLGVTEDEVGDLDHCRHLFPNEVAEEADLLVFDVVVFFPRCAE